MPQGIDMNFFQSAIYFTSVKIIPLIISLIGFSILVVIHELGHFLFCKAFGIHTPTFSVGFGSKIISKKIGNTEFRLAKIPLGGYVEIAGLAEPGQGEQTYAQDKSSSSFLQKSYWKRFLVLTGGIIFNLIFAYLVFFGIFFLSGSQNQVITIDNVLSDSPAAQAGLKQGDEVTAINDISLQLEERTSIHETQELLLQEIRKNPNQIVKFTIRRLDNNNEQKATVIEALLGSRTEGTNEIGTLGAAFALPRLPFIEAIKMGFHETSRWIINIAESLKSLFYNKNLSGAGGPVMILAVGFKQAQGGILPFLIFLAIMSINLALFNLLPLGITDGGQLLFTTIESIIRRPIPDCIRMIVNILSFALFAFLFVYLTYRDIATLFGSFITKLYHKIIGLFALILNQ